MDGDLGTRLMRGPDALKQHRALVVKAERQSLQYCPLSFGAWLAAIKAAWMARVAIAAEYHDVLRSPSSVIRIPSVAVCKNHVKPPKRVSLTRFYSFLRDRFCACDSALGNNMLFKPRQIHRSVDAEGLA